MRRQAALFLETGAIAVEFVATDAVASAWSEPSRLHGYSVGGLAAHLGRAITTVEEYLDTDPPPPSAPTVDAPGYFVAVLGDHDPIDSEFHGRVRERGERSARAGHGHLVASLRGSLDRLRDGRLEADRSVIVRSGLAIRLADYLKTRLVELTVHADDLAGSVGESPPDFGEEVWRTVATVVAAAAIERNGARVAALSLARPDDTPRVGAF